MEMVESVDGAVPGTAPNRGRSLSRTRSLISRFLLCTPFGSQLGEAEVNGQPQPTLRRNPHRRSTGQLQSGHAVRQAFPITALSLLVNVKRDSFVWVDDQLRFTTDTVVPATVQVNFMKRGGVTLLDSQVECGLCQPMKSPASKAGVYSIIIQATGPDPKPDEAVPYVIRTQRTEVELHRGVTGLVPRVITQTVDAGNGAQYSLLEIYGRPSSRSASMDSIGGLGPTVADASIDQLADPDGKECVICLTVERDTIVLPCRHLCLCAECAESLRSRVDKCPICRESCQGLLQVRLIDQGNSVDSLN